MLNDLVSQTQVETLKDITTDKWKQDIETVLANLSTLIDELSTEVTTEKVVTDELVANTKVTSPIGEIDSLQTSNATISRLNGDIVDADRVDATTSNLQNINSESIVTDSITTQELNLNGNFQVGSVQASDVTSTSNTTQNLDANTINSTDITTSTLDATSGSFQDVGVDNLVADSANIDTLNVTSDTTLKDVEAETIDVETINTDTINSTVGTINTLQNTSLSNYKLHANGRLNLDPEQATTFDWYTITIPSSWTNYTLYLAADFVGENNQQHHWNTTIVGTNKVAVISYDEDSLEVIKDFSFSENQVRVRFKGTGYVDVWCAWNGDNDSLAIEYNSEALATIHAPNKTKGYVFKSFNDNSVEFYFGGEVFVHSLAAEFQEFEDQVTKRLYVERNVYLPLTVEPDGTVSEYTIGNEGSYITNRVNEYGNLWVVWVDPESTVKHSGKLITAEGVASYDGSIEYTSQGETLKEYPITELGDDTTVHGDLQADDVTVKGIKTASTAIFDSSTSSLEKVVGFNVVDGVATRKTATSENPVAYEGVLENGKVVVYNETNDTLDTSDSVTLQEGNFSVLKADKAYIKELDVVKEETISSTSDFVTLRANNPSSLGNDKAGLLVNNYDGNDHSLAIVTDSTGTARVGTGTTTDTTYQNLYYADGSWYLDDTLQVEVTPAGALTRWDSVETTDDYIHYTNAVFSQVTFTSLQPFLTREEESAIADKAILIFDKTTSRAIDIAVPDSTEQVLQGDYDSATDTVTYSWQTKQPGVYYFATMADYNNYTGTIPNGSSVVIGSVTSYVKGDRQ